MKKQLIILILITVTLKVWGQEKQFFDQRMKNCFEKLDSVQNQTSRINWNNQNNSDFICDCLKGSNINNFKFLTDDGDTLSLYSISQPFIIFLFAEFCNPCMAEIPAINYLFKKYSDNIVFIGITCDSHKTLNEYKYKYNPKIILIPSPSASIWQSYLYLNFSVKRKSLPIPTVYLINKDKIITAVHVGAEEEFHSEQYVTKDEKAKEMNKETADSINIATLEPLILQLLINK